MMMVRIDARLEWKVARDPKSDRWVGVCPALSITAEADSWANLAEILNQEINELLRDLLDEGELEMFLQDRGWKSLPETPIPKLMPAEGVNFDVPMEIRVHSIAGLSTRAPHAET